MQPNRRNRKQPERRRCKPRLHSRSDGSGDDADGSSPERKTRCKQPERHKPPPERKAPVPHKERAPEHRPPERKEPEREPHRLQEHRPPERMHCTRGIRRSDDGSGDDAGSSSPEQPRSTKPEPHKRPERKVP